MSCFMTLFLLLNFSCEVIETPYMVESNSNPIDTSSFVQKVLIEDFTGHRCKYCPSAARELSSIQNIYGKDRTYIDIYPYMYRFPYMYSPIYIALYIFPYV